MQSICKALLLKMEGNMNTVAVITKKENEKMMDIIEEINSLKVLTKTLAADNELYCKNSKMYGQIKKDLKASMTIYRAAWNEIIKKYQLDPEKGENYMLDFSDRSIHYMENQQA